MQIHQLEKRAKVKRDKTNEAISLASQGRWEEAAALNKELIELFSEDVEALNRLGKALFEIGRYAAARKALERALELAPSNSIARKNLDRMSGLKDAPTSGTAGRLSPQVFIEESGKSTTTLLLGLGSPSALGQVTSGDTVQLVVDGATVAVQNRSGQRLGHLEPKLAARLIKLLSGGNKYIAAIASLSDKSVSVVVREMYQSSKMSRVVSFPSAGGNAPTYIADMDVDLDEDAGFDTSTKWAPPVDDGEASEESSDEQPPVTVKQQRPTRALSDEEVEDEVDEEIEV